MTQNNDLLSAELNKWTKVMLVDYIVTQSLPAGMKLSEDMSEFLKVSTSNPAKLSPGNLVNVANILQSVVEELKSVALINSKLHNKLNRLNATTSVSFPKSNAQPINLPFVVHPKSDADTRSTQPANQLIAGLSSSVKLKFIVGSLKTHLLSCHQCRCASMLIFLSRGLIHVLQLPY
ncbi:unnamed protein product [Macrosiphum euphorbiae]|uniref:Uncharacterized protein n=1 Tax=Macrosiphum euphorbiae TaxID=13131 RepID=A0AAV0WDM5_9HEMI|nr:unnamed protein product [Macrosiphum euphorbiae]